MKLISADRHNSLINLALPVWIGIAFFVLFAFVFGLASKQTSTLDVFIIVLFMWPVIVILAQNSFSKRTHRLYVDDAGELYVDQKFHIAKNNIKDILSFRSWQKYEYLMLFLKSDIEGLKDKEIKFIIRKNIWAVIFKRPYIDTWQELGKIGWPQSQVTRHGWPTDSSHKL
ncbi:MAG: hypothetical protein A3F54_05535 [Candidatus Kerfeldbacteria bacterium RIFCSPHIGHO2_12_FULL_48_17]|uniref:Uncharacterized protein n=1 Tax=Candidatus Kerfeldbacteria bacterium RIFCSPHIGHO2_12_FULL_48_17 TaxID=1798542 RepID=A0A1G2B7E7_9BACT|nr:MAG: hypothetical protein A3F54_05535 [Candidatus Kerfeldbacteria bacterium RIFCSPHIGHO2_12_FULL_48_17]